MRLPQDGPWREIRHVAYNGPGCAPRWPSRPAPRRGPGVCLTWGHSVVDDLGPAAVEPYREAIEVIAELGGRSVVVTAAEQIQALGELPAGALAAPWMPLDLVLPHCDAVVHQGGDGTVLTAAAWGLPQLAMTRTPEHSFAGDRLAASGAGLHLRYEELRGDPARRDAVRGAIAKLLGDAAYRDAACGLRGEIAAQPSPAEIVPALEALT
jgi:glycosyltransferase